MDELTAELVERRAAHDDLESLVDALLGVCDAAVVVVDHERRVRGLSRGALERWEGAALGKPLSSVLPDELYDGLAAQLDAGGPEVHTLPSGAAVVVVG
jgi:hypothetical protein